MNPQEGDWEIPVTCQVFECMQNFTSGIPITRRRMENRYAVGYITPAALRAYHEHKRVAHGDKAAAQSTPQSRMAGRLSAAGLESHTTLHQLIVSGNLVERDTLRHARAFLRDRPAAMVLSGGVGAGKTLSGWWVVAQVDGSRFLVSPDLARPLNDNDRHGYVGAHALVVDDVGLEHLGPSEYARSQLEEILVKREMHGRPTMLTTNLGPDAFRERFGARTWSRIYGSGGFVECAGVDGRQERFHG